MDRASPDIPCPELVLLDIDDTVYDYESAHSAALEAAAAKSERLFGLRGPAFRAAYDEARNAVKERLGAHSASAHSRLLYFHALIEAVGMKSQPLLALDLEQTYWRSFLGAMQLFPGVVDFLEELRHQQIPSVVVTNLTAQIQLRKLVYLRLDGLLDYVVTSEEAGANKPDPAPFTLALTKARKSPGPKIWMIGDSVGADAEGAKRAVQASTLLRRTPRMTVGSPDVDLLFSSFADLLPLLDAPTRIQRVVHGS